MWMYVYQVCLKRVLINRQIRQTHTQMLHNIAMTTCDKRGNMYKYECKTCDSRSEKGNISTWTGKNPLQHITMYSKEDERYHCCCCSSFFSWLVQSLFSFHHEYILEKRWGGSIFLLFRCWSSLFSAWISQSHGGMKMYSCTRITCIKLCDAFLLYACSTYTLKYRLRYIDMCGVCAWLCVCVCSKCLFRFVHRKNVRPSVSHRMWIVEIVCSYSKMRVSVWTYQQNAYTVHTRMRRAAHIHILTTAFHPKKSTAFVKMRYEW